MMTDFLPKVILIESLFAALFYAFAGKWNHTGYWLSGAAITFFVLRMK